MRLFAPTTNQEDPLDNDALRVLRTYVLGLVYALFQDDSADGVLDRVPPPPVMVTSLTPHPHHYDGTRIDGFDLAGTFSTTSVMKLGQRGGRFEDRYDIVTAYVIPYDLPEHMGARLTMDGQPGMTVDTLQVRAETLKNPPTNPTANPEPKAPALPPPTPAVGSIPSAAAPLGPLIGGVERVPPIDLAGLLDDNAYRQIKTLRSFDDFGAVSTYLIADPTLIYFGLPPSFEPIIRLGTDGMTIGLMIDAPELGFVDPAACLYEFSSQGMTLADARLDARGIAWRSVTHRRLLLEETDDADGLQAWQVVADDLKDQMGWSEFSVHGVRGFNWGDKRRKPVGSPKGTKWRTDAGGNGVLAVVEQWGEEPVRRPRSIGAALHKAADSPPALGLHLLREALVKANHTNDGEAAVTVYRAMVEPLNRLGRPIIAARAEALAGLR